MQLFLANSRLLNIVVPSKKRKNQTIMMIILALFLALIANPHNSNEKATSDGGKIIFYDTDCYGSDGTDCDIIVEKYLGDKLEWSAKVGGNSWDYAEDVLEVEDGYLVLGNTGSYGIGNNDVYLTKLDRIGNELWFRTYGGFFNDYGRTITPSNDFFGGYIITGEKQHCLTANVSEKCYMEELFIRVAANGDNLQDNY